MSRQITVVDRIKQMLLAKIHHLIPHHADYDHDRCARFRDTGVGIKEYTDVKCNCGYDEKIEAVEAIIEELEWKLNENKAGDEINE